MTYARGYDVSDYEADIPADAEFALIKATEGAHTDQSGYRAKLADARARGLVVGHYHFFHAENAVTDEVNHFCTVVGDVPAGDLLILDFEPYEQGVDDATCTAKKDQWLAAVKGRYPNNQVGLYTNKDYWHRTNDNAGDFLWIADYANPAGSPAVQHPWKFHQYTDSPLDTNVYNGTLEELRAWSGVPASPVPTVARYQSTIGGLTYGYGAHGYQVTLVGDALVAHGFGAHYRQGPGPDWSDADTLNYADFQRSLGYSGSDADGVPGESSLRRLLGGTIPLAAVSLSKLAAAATRDPGAAQGATTNPDDVWTVQLALVAEGLLNGSDPAWGRGSFGTMTIAAYADWQRRLGYGGSDADGVPGASSLGRLGSRHGFTVAR